MKNAWAVSYGCILCFIKFAFQLLTHPAVLLMATGAMLLRIVQIAW